MNISSRVGRVKRYSYLDLSNSVVFSKELQNDLARPATGTMPIEPGEPRRISQETEHPGGHAPDRQAGLEGKKGIPCDYPVED